jgi:hypothetical protein
MYTRHRGGQGPRRAVEPMMMMMMMIIAISDVILRNLSLYYDLCDRNTRDLEAMVIYCSLMIGISVK